MTAPLNPVTAGFALLLLIGLPVLAAIDVRRGVDLTEAAVHRGALYLSVAFSLLVIALLTAGVAAWQDVPSASMGWTVEDPATAMAWGVGVTVIGLGLIWLVTHLARLAGLTESPVAMLLMPRNSREKRGFLLLSGFAAVCEEFAFRGFGLWAMSAWTGNAWLAAVLVSISFGFAHGYQKLAGILRAATLGLLLAAATNWTGSLFPAIVGHFWINAAVGMGGWRYLISDSSDIETDSPANESRGGDEEER